jgi:hypothetical protein
MAVQFFRAGAFGTDVITDFIVLWGKVSVDNNVTHLRKFHATSGYQVTAGKTLHLVKLRYSFDFSSTFSVALKMGYADNDVGLDTATARTNPVMAFGLDDTSKNGITEVVSYGSAGMVVDGLKDADHAFVGPLSVASKFPFARVNSGAFASSGIFSIFAWCIEA